MAKLTVKQQKFADEYIISGNATEAAKKAGYAKRSAQQIGAENLLKPVIKSYIDNRMEELKSEKVADQQEIAEFLTSVIRGEVTEPLAIADGDYAQKVVMVLPGVSARRQAAVDLGKRYGMWTDKQEVTGNVGLVQIIDDIPGESDG